MNLPAIPPVSAVPMKPHFRMKSFREVYHAVTLPPALVVMLVGKRPWVMPILVPVFVLWPLLLAAGAAGAAAGSRRVHRILAMSAAIRGMRVDVTSRKGHRFLLSVI